MHQVCHERLSSRLLEHLEHLEHLVLESDSRLHGTPACRAARSRLSRARRLRRAAAQPDAARCRWTGAAPRGSSIERALEKKEHADPDAPGRRGRKIKIKNIVCAQSPRAVNAMAAIMGTWVKGHAMAPPRRDAMRGVCPAGPWRGPWGRACGGRVLVGCCRVASAVHNIRSYS